MSARPAPPASRLVEAYDPGFRSGMLLAAAEADDPAALRAALDRLPAVAVALFWQLRLVAVPGEPLPERLRDRIARDGLALWQAALLLPRASGSAEGIHPQHYAGSCRLNPATQALLPPLAHHAPTAPPSFPPADARWDAVVVAAALEANPGTLTMDGTLRRDVERRLVSAWGDDEARWGLALRTARARGLVRTSGQRLIGLPEAVPRPVGDPAQLAADPLTAQAVTLVSRLVGPEWTATADLLELLKTTGRETFFSAVGGGYPLRAESFDEAGFASIEAPAVRGALDLLHRVGLLDATRDHEGVTAFRQAGERPPGPGNFMVTPDGGVLVHVAEARLADYGRLCRLAPFVDGDALRRHRLTRDGVSAEIGAGHRDALDFLRANSRTGVPSNLVSQVEEWQRSATRIAVITGVDVVESADGTLRLAGPDEHGRVIDYGSRPRARFFAQGARLYVPDGWDPLDLRATLARVARLVGREGDAHVYEAERRVHPAPDGLLSRLRDYHGGDLPGELEAMVLAGSMRLSATIEDAVIVQLPAPAAAALRRDRVAAPLLRRWLPGDECVVSRADLPALQARFAALGVEWEG